MIGNVPTSRHNPRATTVAFAALTVFALMGAAGNAQAHEVRFVASYGNNANLCSRAAPCLTLQRGINRTPAGGELIILDSGDYGNSGTISKSITISAIGASATLGGSITIDNADATVVLRGLRLNGVNAAPNANGINIVAATAVHVEDLDIQAFGFYGIAASSTAAPQLFVSNTVVRNCRFGLVFEPAAGGTLTLDNSQFNFNQITGVSISGAEAVLTNTIASGNGGYGVVQAGGKINVIWTTAEHNGAGGYGVFDSGQMSLEQSVAHNNNDCGVCAKAGTVRISGSVVTNNGTGVLVEAGSTLLTRVNNTVSGNTMDIAGAVTPLGGI